MWAANLKIQVFSNWSLRNQHCIVNYEKHHSDEESPVNSAKVKNSQFKVASIHVHHFNALQKWPLGTTAAIKV